jgi:hypothetical protein
MTRLQIVPNGADMILDPERPFVYAEANGMSARFVIAPFRRRWLLFDVSGTTRVGGRAVAGGAATLRDGELISCAGLRFRLNTADGRATRLTTGREGLCSYCRERVSPGDVRHECPSCRRIQHESCLRASGKCGRCGKALRPEE